MFRDRINKILSLEEFVIDEQPVPVYGMQTKERASVPATEAGEVATVVETAEETGVGEGAEPTHPLDFSARPAAGPVTPATPAAPDLLQADLLSQLMDMMVEQVKLAEKARFLETQKSGDDEFGRFVRQVLPFLDNFSRLLDLAREYPPSEEMDNWLKSVEALYFRIVNLLENYGLVFINSTGKPVDFDYHEIVEYRDTQDYPHNVVIRELQKGVVFRGRLLRDAKVIVACNQ